MQDIIGVVAIFAISIPISIFEYQKFASLLTPFNLMAYPYAITVAMVNLVAVNFGFFHVSLESVFYYILCLLLFKIGELAVEKIAHPAVYDAKVMSFQKEQMQEIFNYYTRFFIGVAIISIVASGIHFIRALNEVGGWMFLASKEFEEAYGKGILSHVGQLNKPAFMFLFGYFFFSKKKYVPILLFLMFMAVLLLQIKTHIITTLLSGILFCYFFGIIKINLKKLLLYSLIIFALFNISYMIGFSKINVAESFSSDVQIALANHFFTYLFGGSIGFSEILKFSNYPLYSPDEIFAVPINLYNVFYGGNEVVDVVIYNWIPVSTNYQYFHSSNVFNLFGVLYMYLGWWGTFLYVFALGVVSQVLKIAAIKKGATFGLQMAYVYFLCFLMLAFFNIF